MFWVVINRLVGNEQFGGAAQGFAAAGVAGEARVRAAGDLQAQAMTSSKTVRGGPEVEGDAQGAVGLSGRIAGFDALQGVADVDGFALEIDIAEAREEISILQVGLDIKIGLHRPNDLKIALKGRAGVG